MLQACSFFLNPFLEFRLLPRPFSFKFIILFHMFAHAFEISAALLCNLRHKHLFFQTIKRILDHRKVAGAWSLQDDMCQAVSHAGLSQIETLRVSLTAQAPRHRMPLEVRKSVFPQGIPGYFQVLAVWRKLSTGTLVATSQFEPELRTRGNLSQWTEVLNHSWQVASPLCSHEFYFSHIHQAVLFTSIQLTCSGDVKSQRAAVRCQPGG